MRPRAYFLLSEGQHTFAVRATDAAGNTDQTPAEYTWKVDSLRPRITFTERPGRHLYYVYWITNDTSPTWAWTVRDANLDPDSGSCDIYDSSKRRTIIYIRPCYSPYTFEAELPDGHYSFEISAHDKAYNSRYAYNDFEVDTVAPKIASFKPTGASVGRYANAVVAFDDHVYDSKQFVNIYQKGSSTPLTVYRYGNGSKKIELEPKSFLKRGTWYTVKVTTGVNDGANNLEAPRTWNFKTRG